jgi:AAA+ ATPase superfamily predicted ATPase
MLSEVIGRTKEIERFERINSSISAEFVAVYGRRRVGKTFLTREFFAEKAEIYFSVTGKKDGTYEEHLDLFRQELGRVFYTDDNYPPVLKSWSAALKLLADKIDEVVKSKPDLKSIVVFLDELPWLATARSKLIQAIDHSWNTRLSAVKNMRLIVCGSAASWMLEKLIHAKGGLYNRVTQVVHLFPFSLKEVELFLNKRGAKYSRQQLVEITLALGGVPFYLNQILPSLSPAQNIGRLFFEQDSPLKDEFKKLFQSLFKNAPTYEALIRAIAKKKIGSTLDELTNISDMSSGGGLTDRLRELEDAGFIKAYPQYRKKKKELVYRLVDEFCWFHLTWIETGSHSMLTPGAGEMYWMQRAQLPQYRIWLGYAFEMLCLKYEFQIRKALRIDSIASETNVFRFVPSKAQAVDGVQIDLLFDRADNIITLCEMKYSSSPILIDKSLATELKSKIEAFERITKTKKQISLAIVSPLGIKQSIWSEGLVDGVVRVEELF